MDERSDMEYEGEDPGEGGLVKFNPIGEYYGGRNDKNERHGRGRTVLPNGDLYLGCYFRGKRHGLGVYRYKNGNGARYGGDWVNGFKNGWGTMYFPDGSQYTGHWHRGVMHGWGFYVYSNGDEYEGWFFMGAKNGRGIYRTKATNEKFVGDWLLGLKHGRGMIVRPEFRFIGNWHNDVPKGSGVYIFPDLGVEQHGRYTVVKLQAESISKYKDLGYQVVMMRSTPPAMNPLDYEENARKALQVDALYDEMNAGEDDPGETKNPSQSPPGKGEGDGKEPNKSGDIPPEERMELKVVEKLKAFVNEELEGQEANQIPVAPVWRAMQVTRLITKYLDEVVPPPPMPETPIPEVDEGAEEEDADEAGRKTSKDENEEIRQAKLLAKTHALGEIYTGSGVCQLPLAKIRWPDDIVIPRTFSKVTVSTIEEFKNVVETIAPQLEPLDIQAIIAENLNVFRGHGINVSEKWKECLGNDAECADVEIKGVPPEAEQKRKSSAAGSARKSSIGRAEAADAGAAGEEEEFLGEDEIEGEGDGEMGEGRRSSAGSARRRSSGAEEDVTTEAETEVEDD